MIIRDEISNDLLNKTIYLMQDAYMNKLIKNYDLKSRKVQTPLSSIALTKYERIVNQSSVVWSSSRVSNKNLNPNLESMFDRVELNKNSSSILNLEF